MDRSAALRPTRRGLSLAIATAVAAALGTFASPAWSASVAPTYNASPDNPCTGLYKHDSGSSGTLNGPDGADPGGDPDWVITITADGSAKSIDFSITDGYVVTFVQVKGGTPANDYGYGAGTANDSFLHAPGKDGTTGVGYAANQRYGVSHVCFSVTEYVSSLPVTFQSVSAKRVGGSVTLRWKTSSELDMLGYNVWIERNGKRVKVNKRLIMAKGNAGGSYSATARVPKAKKGPVRMWLEVVNLDGSRTWRLVTAR